jgi:hypothetical protein
MGKVMIHNNSYCGGVTLIVILVATLTLSLFQQTSAAELEIFADGFEDNASAQVAAARIAPDGPASLQVDKVIITYVKPLIGNDPAGFFVQASKAGPALFVAPTQLPSHSAEWSNHQALTLAVRSSFSTMG